MISLEYETYQDMLKTESYQNLHITLICYTPICLAAPWVNFDGIVAHLLARLKLGNQFYSLPSDDPLNDIVNDLELPFRTVLDVPMTSAILLNTETINSNKLVTIYKRFTSKYVHELKTKKTKLDTNRGIYKDYRLRLPYILQKNIDVYCLGKQESLRLLLHFLTGLGKKINIGFGQIHSFKIEKSNKNIWDNKSGTILRPIPAKYCQFFEEAVFLPYRPPYWSRKNVALSVPVGSKCELIDDFLPWI